MQKQRIARPIQIKTPMQMNKRPDLYWPPYPNPPPHPHRVSMMRRSNPCKMNLAMTGSMQKGYQRIITKETQEQTNTEKREKKNKNKNNKDKWEAEWLRKEELIIHRREGHFVVGKQPVCGVRRRSPFRWPLCWLQSVSEYRRNCGYRYNQGFQHTLRTPWTSRFLIISIFTGGLVGSGLWICGKSVWTLCWQ